MHILGEIIQPPPPKWWIFIGDISHKLRNFLDHMVWELALTQTIIPYNKIEFP